MLLEQNEFKALFEACCITVQRNGNGQQIVRAFVLFIPGIYIYIILFSASFPVSLDSRCTIPGISCGNSLSKVDSPASNFTKA